MAVEEISDLPAAADAAEAEGRRPAGGGPWSGIAESRWALPALLLTGFWLLLAFRGGAYEPRLWMAPGLALALFVAVSVAAGALPRSPGRLGLAVLTCFALYAAWSAASTAWAWSFTRAWDEAARTLFYLVFFGFALCLLTDARARLATRYLLLAFALLLVGLTAWRLGTVGDGVEALFQEKRLIYPVSYPNGAGALFLLLFWPLLGLAGDRYERLAPRALALGASVGLMGMGLLTQSRGAAWALIITGAVALALSPRRLRLLLVLPVPFLLFAYYFGELNRYWTDGPVAMGGSSAARMILLMSGAATLAGFFLVLLDRSIRVGSRSRLVVGAVVLLTAAVSLIYAYRGLEQEVGDPQAWARSTWSQFSADERVFLPGFDEDGPTRLVAAGASHRWSIWRVAWRTFEEYPWRGIGVGSFTYAHDLYRLDERIMPRQPHSIQLDVLSETGVLGAVPFLGMVGLAFGGVLWPRFRAGWAEVRRRGPAPFGRTADYAWPVSLLLGVVYWLAHGTVDWLWHIPGVTLGVLLLLALALSEVDATRERGPMARGTDHALIPATPPPAPPVSRRLRLVGAVVSLALLAALSVTYLSFRYDDLALRTMDGDPQGAARAAQTAARLQPWSPEPLLTQADAFREEARTAERSGDSSRARAASAMALASERAALEKERANWLLHLRVALGAVALGEHQGESAPSNLSEPWVGDVGVREDAVRLLALTTEELRDLALSSLEDAQSRNPLQPRVQALLLEMRSGGAGT